MSGDIRKFAVEESAVLKLVDAAEQPMMGDDGQQMWIEMYGPGSKTFAKAKAEQDNVVMDRMVGKRKSDLSAEDKIRERADFLAKCTKASSPNIKYDDLTGAALHKAVYSDIGLGFLPNQAERFIGNWANFLKPSTTT